IRTIPKHAASDPATFAVSGKGFAGRAQVVAFKEEAVLVWMPDSPAGAGFVTVDVATVEAPTPQEIGEIRLSNQPDGIIESSDGFLWFSAWGNEIYRIDPKTDIPEPMTGATATGTPDGLMVDSSDSVWFASYNGHYLGTLSASAPLTRYDVP